MLVRQSDIPAKPVANARGGEGTIFAHQLLAAYPGSALKSVGITRLPPGTSVGLHEHHGDEDFYFCLSGQGIVLDHDTEKPFTPGTLQITRHGQSQAIRNTGNEDLIFLGALIATLKT